MSDCLISVDKIDPFNLYQVLADMWPIFHTSVIYEECMAHSLLVFQLQVDRVITWQE